MLNEPAVFHAEHIENDGLAGLSLWARHAAQRDLNDLIAFRRDGQQFWRPHLRSSTSPALRARPTLSIHTMLDVAGVAILGVDLGQFAHLSCIHGRFDVAVI